MFACVLFYCFIHSMQDGAGLHSLLSKGEDAFCLYSACAGVSGTLRYITLQILSYPYITSIIHSIMCAPNIHNVHFVHSLGTENVTEYNSFEPCWSDCNWTAFLLSFESVNWFNCGSKEWKRKTSIKITKQIHDLHSLRPYQRHWMVIS